MDEIPFGVISLLYSRTSVIPFDRRLDYLLSSTPGLVLEIVTLPFVRRVTDTLSEVVAC